MPERQVQLGLMAKPHARGPQSIDGSTFQSAPQDFKVFGNLSILNLQLVDAFDTMHHSGVISPTKTAPNLGQRTAGHLLAQIHGHLPRTRKGAQAFRANHIAEANIVVIRDLPLNFLDVLRAAERKTSARQSCVNSNVISCPTSDAKANSRVSAPSRTRTFELIRWAKNSKTPSANLRPG